MGNSNQPNKNAGEYKNATNNERKDSAEINDMTASVNASQISEETSTSVIKEIHSQHTHDPTDVIEYLQVDSSQPSVSRNFSFYRNNDNEVRASYDMLGRKTDRNEEDCMSEISDQSFKSAVSAMDVDAEIEDSCFLNDALMNEDHTPSVNESTRVPCYSNSCCQQLSREPQRYEDRSPTNCVPDSRLFSQDLGETSTCNNFDLLEIHDSEKKFPTNEYRQISEDVNAGEILCNTQEENLEALSCIPKIENTTCILSDEMASSTHEKNEINARNISSNLSQTKEKSCGDLCFHIDDISKAIQKALENINTAKAILSSANRVATDKSGDFQFDSNISKVISNRVNSTEEVKSKESFQEISVLKNTNLKEDSKPKTAYFSSDAVANAMQTALNKLRKKNEFSLKGYPLHDAGIAKEVPKGDSNHGINECSQNLQTLDLNVSQTSVVPVDIEPQQSTIKRKISSPQGQTDEAAFVKCQKVFEAKKVSKSRSCSELPRTMLTRSHTALKTLNSTSTKSIELEIKEAPDTKTNKLKRQKVPDAKTNKREIQKALDSKTNGQERQKVPVTKKAPKSRLERTIFTRSETALKLLNSTTVKSNYSKRQKALDGKIVARSQGRVCMKTDNDVSSQGTFNSISTKSNEFASIRDNLRRAFSPHPTTSFVLNNEREDMISTDNDVSSQRSVKSNLSKPSDFATIKDNLRRAFSPHPTTSFVLNNEKADMALTGDTSSNSTSMSFVVPPLFEDQSVQTLHGSANFGVATGNHTNEKDSSQQIPTRGNEIFGDHVYETEVEVFREGDQ